jgi:hypothetical protein
MSEICRAGFKLQVLDYEETFNRYGFKKAGELVKAEKKVLEKFRVMTPVLKTLPVISNDKAIKAYNDRENYLKIWTPDKIEKICNEKNKKCRKVKRF